MIFSNIGNVLRYAIAGALGIMQSFFEGIGTGWTGLLMSGVLLAIVTRFILVPIFGRAIHSDSIREEYRHYKEVHK